MRPCSRTIIQSLLRTVERRCAITNVVLPLISLSMPFCTSFSVLVSMELVASSRISAGGSATAALAIARSCLWPWLKLAPSPVSIVLYPSGSLLIKLCAFASFAALTTSSSVASSFPYLIFSITVPVKRCVSCNTIPSDWRKSFFLILLILMPS